MSINKFEIIIASLPDRERLVAEIYYENKYWAEISDENKKMIIPKWSEESGF